MGEAVQSQAQWSEPLPAELRLTEGARLTLHCAVESSVARPVRFVWRKGARDLTASRRHLIMSDTMAGSSELRVLNVLQIDRGEYEVSAASSDAELRSSCRVLVDSRSASSIAEEAEYDDEHQVMPVHSLTSTPSGSQLNLWQRNSEASSRTDMISESSTTFSFGSSHLRASPMPSTSINTVYARNYECLLFFF